MWDALTIPSQRDLLQEALKGMDVAKDTIQGCSPSNSTSLVKPLEAYNPKKISNPPPFYLSLFIGNNIVHNCMIDNGANNSVMPKGIANHLCIKYEPITRGFVKLDGTSVQIVEVIKDLNLTLHAYSGCSVLQDI